MKVLAAILAMLMVVVASHASPAATLPKEVDNALNSSKQVVLYSLEPWADPKSKVERFHNYEVLGKLVLNPTQRLVAVGAFRAAVASYHDTGYVATCFDPRHALHVVNDGHTYDILLCYQCLQVQVFRDNVSIAWLGATGSPKVLNSLLDHAGVAVSTSGGNSQ